MERNRSRALFAASVAGLLASVGMGTSRQQVHANGEEGVACYGINKCQEPVSQMVSSPQKRKGSAKTQRETDETLWRLGGISRLCGDKIQL